MNAVNFVDGLDGLAAGVVGIGALAFFVFCYQLANLNGVSLATTGALLSASLAGACAGFLPHNFHPARLFMGDSGSMLIGLVLSASALTLTGQFSGPELSQGAEGSPGQPAADAAAAAAPGLDPDRADGRPDPGRRPPHPRRALAVRARTSSTCTTGCSRSGTRQRRAVFIMWMWAALVAVRHGAGQPLTGPWMFGSLRRWPPCYRRADLRGAGPAQAGGPRAARGGPPGKRPGDFVIVFTSTPHPDLRPPI